MEYQNDNKISQPNNEAVNQEQNFSNIPPQHPNRNLKIIIGVLVIILVGALEAASYYIFKDKNISRNEQPTPINRKVYFGKGFEGKYSLVNIDSGETKEFIPAGYTIISQHNYDVFPDYLILQKGNDLFSFNLENQLLNSLFGQLSDLKLKKNEQVVVKPSITEKNKFYVVIKEHKLTLSINTRSYFFDASVNKLESTRNIDFDGCCYKYDSKNQRFFTWPCVGGSIPLSIIDLNGNNSRDIVSMQDYGLIDNFVQYNNGMFMVSERGGLSKITVVNPAPAEPTKDVYVINSSVKSQLNETYPYSETIDKNNNTIVIGGDHFILLLKYDTIKQIIESKYIPDKEIYANFIFPYNGKIFFQSKDALRIINLASWQLEKSIPLQRNEEITLISLTPEEKPPITEDEFKDWKTYRNEEFGIKMKYPSNWTIQKEEIIIDKNLELEISPLREQEDIDFIISIGILQGIELSEYVNSLIEFMKGFDPTSTIESKKIILSNTPAYQIIYTPSDESTEPDSKIMEIVVMKKHVLYTLIYQTKNNKYPEFIEEVEKMINSFEIFSLPQHLYSSEDLRRKGDMYQLLLAQEMYFENYDRYYTCSTGGGDCGGKINNYPSNIETHSPTTPKDPINEDDYIYKGLDNTKNPQEFCYYAKFDLGRYYTASHNGNFERSTPPTNFVECTTSDL